MDLIHYIQHQINLTTQLKEFYSDTPTLQRLDGEIKAYQNILDYLEAYE